MFDWLRRRNQQPNESRSASRGTDVESDPPRYVVDGITVEAHRLVLRNRQAVEQLAALILNHADKLEVGKRIRSANQDAYVVGYLAGVIDALSQEGGVTDIYQRTGMLERLYAAIFSRGMQSGALDWFLKHQDSNAILQGGMQDGGDDYLAFLSKEVRTFGALFRHLSQEA